jgi:hypothetical protein
VITLDYVVPDTDSARHGHSLPFLALHHSEHTLSPCHTLSHVDTLSATVSPCHTLYTLSPFPPCNMLTSCQPPCHLATPCTSCDFHLVTRCHLVSHLVTFSATWSPCHTFHLVSGFVSQLINLAWAHTCDGLRLRPNAGPRVIAIPFVLTMTELERVGALEAQRFPGVVSIHSQVFLVLWLPEESASSTRVCSWPSVHNFPLDALFSTNAVYDLVF